MTDPDNRPRASEIQSTLEGLFAGAGNPEDYYDTDYGVGQKDDPDLPPPYERVSELYSPTLWSVCITKLGLDY